MKKLTFTLLLALTIGSQVFAQSNSPLFIGVQPNITVEPFYDDGEFDIDIVPLVFEASIGSRINLKITPIVNYHIGGTSNGLSDIGVFAVLPLFLKSKETKEDRPSGFYLGPVLGFGRNILNNHYTSTVALEPGYMFEAKKRFTISIGLQLGGSYFSYDSKPNQWLSHWGPKISLGYWISY